MSRSNCGSSLAVLVTLATVAACTALAATPDAPKSPERKADTEADKADGHHFAPFKPESVTTSGSVTIAGRAITYQAVAGTLIVHPKGWDDVPRDPNADKAAAATAAGTEGPEGANPSAEASMFYVAYFRSGAGPRPLTFFYNGGPGSSTMWLHMGAFGPRRIVTATDAHTPAAPYSLINNASSLLDATDMVFIDAPGTGFSRIAGKDKEKSFFGIDPDAYAFAEFISQFLSKYGRWNSPKYLFGESYGTPRSAVVVNELEADRSIDLNGIMLLSQILSFDLSPDRPTSNPGVDLPYETVLPTYAATAWYHHKLPGEHPSLDALLIEVEQFATGEYARALAAGSELSASERSAVAEKLHQYTGLPVDYILKADLRIDGGEFRQTLQSDGGLTTGRLDTRFSGPDLDPLSQRADYDPQAAALSSAYVTAFNEYVRKELRYGEGQGVPAERAAVPHLEFLAPAAGADPGVHGTPGNERDAGPRQCHEAQPQPQGATARRLLRPCDPLLSGRLRDAPSADTAEPAGQHRILLLRVGTHGLREGRIAPETARQRRGLHPPHQPRRAMKQRPAAQAKR